MIFAFPQEFIRFEEEKVSHVTMIASPEGEVGQFVNNRKLRYPRFIARRLLFLTFNLYQPTIDNTIKS